NSLKLKFWIQLRKVDPDGARAAIDGLITNAELLTGNADNFSVPFGTTNGNQHPLYDFAFNRRPGDIAISQRFIDSLKATADPRLDVYFNDQGQGDYLGFDNGGTGTPPLLANRAVLGSFPVGDNGEAPQRLYTYYTQQFYLAEAVLTLGTSGDARNYYEEALAASLGEAGVSSSDADEYIASRLNAYDAAASAEDQLAVIIRDKWVSNLANGVEAFNDWRRTGYPRLAPSNTPLTPDGSIPVRLLYSANELSSNPNLENQSQLIDPVWWDVE
ncbi:MAG: SusD/RagB family nutrient-binding outer membrane lipoprotein, partial [Cyclobacteriaceae bacterium]